MAPKVYLAGPITGMTYDGMMSWREHAVAELKKEGIVGLSPLRMKDYLKDLIGDGTVDHTYENTLLSRAKTIWWRDQSDVRSCDAVLANFKGASRASNGTHWELGMAFALSKPTVIVIDSDDTLNKNALAEQWANVVDDLDDGLFLLKALFHEGG